MSKYAAIRVFDIIDSRCRHEFQHRFLFKYRRYSREQIIIFNV